MHLKIEEARSEEFLQEVHKSIYNRLCIHLLYWYLSEEEWAKQFLFVHAFLSQVKTDSNMKYLQPNPSMFAWE